MCRVYGLIRLEHIAGVSLGYACASVCGYLCAFVCVFAHGCVQIQEMTLSGTKSLTTFLWIASHHCCPSKALVLVLLGLRLRARMTQRPTSR